MIKIVFFDIDGTLVSPTLKRVPDSAIKAINALKAKGILCFVATGRHPNNTLNLGIEELGFDGILGLNGQMATDSKGNVLFCTEMDKEDQAKIAENFAKKEHSIVIVEKDEQYFNYLDEKVIEFRKRFKLAQPHISEYSGNPILQGVIYMDEAEEREFMKQFKNAKSARWNALGFDIINAKGGKDVGIKKLLEILKLNREEAMAFGDNNNDLEMLEYVGTGIAMGNGIDELKAIADYVTDDVDEDGIYNALKHFDLI